MNKVGSSHQRGNTLLGFILGLVIGLGIAVAVALYITNAPVPFVTKVKPASEAVNPATAGDPNKPLYQAPPQVKEEFRLPLHPDFFGPQDPGLVILEVRGDEALGVYQGLFANVVGRHLVQVGPGNF